MSTTAPDVRRVPVPPRRRDPRTLALAATVVVVLLVVHVVA